MSYFKLINGLKDILFEDSRIKTVTEGDIDDFDQYKQNIPTLAHIIVSSGTTEDNLNIYSVLVQVTDIVVENNNITVDKFLGNDNRQEVFNDTDNIIRRFYLRFRQQATGLNMYIDGQPTFDKILEEETDNRLAGWSVTFDVGVPNELIEGCETV